MKKVDAQNICVAAIACHVILNSESFSNCLTAKARLEPM